MNIHAIRTGSLRVIRRNTKPDTLTETIHKAIREIESVKGRKISNDALLAVLDSIQLEDDNSADAKLVLSIALLRANLTSLIVKGKFLRAISLNAFKALSRRFTAIHNYSPQQDPHFVIF